MNWIKTFICYYYLDYKYYHFYACCFGAGCGTALYSPYRSPVAPAAVGLFCTVMFEVFGLCCSLPPHTNKCKGPPYCKEDVYWGFCFAIIVAVVNSHSYHVYVLAHGCGIIVFALRGAKRKYSFLWKSELWW